MFGKAEKDPLAEAGQAASVRSLGSAGTAPEMKPAPVNPAPGTQKPRSEPSVISADLKLVGNLESAGDVQIDGTVEGDIKSRSVTIGEGAHIDGSIVADKVRICGSVSGQVKGTAVSITKTARVEGDVTYKTLSVDEGAVLEGHCRRSESPAKASSESRVSTLKPPTPPSPLEGGSKPAIG
jgi:cytoskeletal protein CcmA (bactofilin family)